LGGQGVAELVGVDGADAGVVADAGDDAVHGAPVDGRVVVGDQPSSAADVLGVASGPVGEQRHEVVVERDEPVVAELAHRHPQPVSVTDAGDGIGGELAELAGPQTGAGQDLSDEAIAGDVMGAGGGHELGGLLVGEELGQRLRPWRDVAMQDRVAAVGVGPVPLDEPLQEDTDHAQPLPLGVLRQRRALGAGLGREPHLVVLDMGSCDVGDHGDVGVDHKPAGELAQRLIGGVDAAGRQERGELQQVAAHGRHQLRRPHRQLGPLAV
jgi:hypothetical protein